MFNKKCKHCNKKVERGFDFCPYCANPLKNEKEDYGLIGKNDDDFTSLAPKQPPSVIDKIIGSTVISVMKMFEREMSQRDFSGKNQGKLPMDPNSNLQLYVNGQRIPIPGQENRENKNKEIENPKIIKKAPKISEETLKKSIKLPRKEAKSKLTRLKDRIVYELDTPGINSLNNVVVNQLENSIEIKAYTDKTVYIKTLNVKLPLISYSMKEDKLFLEFKSN